MQQLEVHLGGCSWCLARFTAWGDSRTQFDALPPPLAPPRRSRVLPVVVGAVGLLGLVGAVTGIVAWRVDRVEAQVDAVTWHGEYATVELRMGGRTLGKDERPLPGSLVAVWLDAHHAPFMSIARQTGDEFELLVSGPVARDGLHLAPVEVLVGDTPATWLHVVLAEHELNVEGVAAAVLSGAPLTPATSVSLTP
jgi:hypothetical protein